MSLTFRRGKDAMEQSAQSAQNSGDLSPFLPNFFWKDDKQKKYLWILNPAEEIPTVKTISPFTNKGRPEIVVSRQDKALGENTDPIEDQWGYGPADNGICIAVELEPVMEVEDGRTRPKGFEVKTRTFERRVRDDDGELTDEREKVTAPSIGVICQSTTNFFNSIAYRDTNNGPINEFPLEITRLGTDTSTSYTVDVYETQPLVMDGLLDHWENISYLTDEDKDELFDDIEEAGDDQEASSILGNFLLDKWLAEHASQEFYDEVLNSIESVAKYASTKYKKAHEGDSESKSSRKGKTATRKTRTSQRRSRREEPAEEPQAEEPDPEPESEVEAEPEDKPKRTRRSRRKAEEPVTKESPVKARLEQIKADNARQREARRKAAA